MGPWNWTFFKVTDFKIANLWQNQPEYLQNHGPDAIRYVLFA